MHIFPSITLDTPVSLPELVLSASVRQILDAWRDLFQAGGEIPKKQDLDPARFANALNKVWMYRRRDDGQFVCILAGEEIRRAWGHSLKDRTLKDFVGPRDLPLVISRFAKVIDTPCIAHAFNPTSGREHTYAERLLTPLRDADGAVNTVLGVSEYGYVEDTIDPDSTVHRVIRFYRPEDLSLIDKQDLGKSG